MTDPTIGVLALQGAVEPHIEILRSLRSRRACSRGLWRDDDLKHYYFHAEGVPWEEHIKVKVKRI